MFKFSTPDLSSAELTPSTGDPFSYQDIKQNLDDQQFSGASILHSNTLEQSLQEHAPSQGEFLDNMVPSANIREPLTDREVHAIAKTINDSFGWIDYEEQALESLKNLSPDEVRRVNEAFVEKFGQEWEVGSIRELFIDQMAGANLDLGLDRLEGFNPDRAARLVHEAGYSFFRATNLKEEISGLTPAQFDELSKAFEEQYDKPIAEFLDDRLWGFEVTQVLEPVYGKEALEVADIIQDRLGSAKYSEAAFVIASLDPEQRALVESTYEAKYGVGLNEEYAQLTPEHRRLIEEGVQNSPLAIEVVKLHQSFGFWSNDVDTMTEILQNRSPEQMNELMRAYSAVYKADFMQECIQHLGTDKYNSVVRLVSASRNPDAKIA